MKTTKMRSYFIFLILQALVTNSLSVPASREEATTEAQYDFVEAGITEEALLPISQELEDIRSEDCKCGQAGDPMSILNLNKKVVRSIHEVDPLIIGGNAAGEEEFPWMATIVKKRFFDGKHKVICGGSVINSRYIVTAAHCIKSQVPTFLEIWLKAHNISNVKGNDKMIRLKVRRLIPHPGWDAETVANDIGLIEVSAPILFSSQKLNPVCLPTKDEGDFASENGTVVGFGYMRPTGLMANVLQKLVVPILSHEDCTKTKYGEIVGSNPAFLCAGFEEGGKDACTNDSGGPLTVEKDGRHKLVGIVSWGHGCAQPMLPGVYTRVTEYMDWIDSIVKPKTRCIKS